MPDKVRQRSLARNPEAEHLQPPARTGQITELPNTQDDTLPSTAAAWATAGFHVVPMHAGNKKPACRWKDCTAPSVETAKRLFERQSEVMLSIALPSNLCVLDIDHRPERAWDAGKIHNELKMRFGLPDSPVTSTPSGGFHLWLRLPEGVKAKNWTSQSGRFPITGIDVRTKGGLIVVPPSERPDGKYSWEHWQAVLPIAPAPLVDALSAPLPPPLPSVDPKPFDQRRITLYVERAYQTELSRVRSAKPGGRNLQLFKSSAALGEIVGAGALPLGHVRQSLFMAAEVCGLVSEDGPAAARATIESGLNRGMANPRKLPDPGRRPW